MTTSADEQPITPHEELDAASRELALARAYQRAAKDMPSDALRDVAARKANAAQRRFDRAIEAAIASDDEELAGAAELAREAEERARQAIADAEAAEAERIAALEEAAKARAEATVALAERDEHVRLADEARAEAEAARADAEAAEAARLAAVEPFEEATTLDLGPTDPPPNDPELPGEVDDDPGAAGGVVHDAPESGSAPSNPPDEVDDVDGDDPGVDLFGDDK